MDLASAYQLVIADLSIVDKELRSENNVARANTHRPGSPEEKRQAKDAARRATRRLTAHWSLMGKIRKRANEVGKKSSI